MRNSKLKLTGGISIPDKRGKITIPPDGAIELPMDVGKDYIVIQAYRSKELQHSERGI